MTSSLTCYNISLNLSSPLIWSKLILQGCLKETAALKDGLCFYCLSNKTAVRVSSCKNMTRSHHLHILRISIHPSIGLQICVARHVAAPWSLIPEKTPVAFPPQDGIQQKRLFTAIHAIAANKWITNLTMNILAWISHRSPSTFCMLAKLHQHLLSSWPTDWRSPPKTTLLLALCHFPAQHKSRLVNCRNTVKPCPWPFFSAGAHNLDNAETITPPETNTLKSCEINTNWFWEGWLWVIYRWKFSAFKIQAYFNTLEPVLNWYGLFPIPFGNL